MFFTLPFQLTQYNLSVKYITVNGNHERTITQNILDIVLKIVAKF